MSQPTASSSPSISLLDRFCYIFPACGVADLQLCMHQPGRLSFAQTETHVPFPRNGFYQLEPDIERYRASVAVYRTMSGTLQAVPARIDVVYAFVSLANANRAVRERMGISSSETIKCAHEVRLYETGIRLSGDESAVKMLDLVSRREHAVTFCSTDDEITHLVPEQLRLIVAEALAGLALCALYDGRIFQCVGYATAALFKHHASLPMVACSRLVALARRDGKATLMLTEMVLLPFYLRCDPLCGLPAFDVEIHQS